MWKNSKPENYSKVGETPHASGACFVRPHDWQKKEPDEKKVIGAEALNFAGKTRPPIKPADIMTRMRARRHDQKRNCQRNQPGEPDCQKARKSHQSDQLIMKKKLAA